MRRWWLLKLFVVTNTVMASAGVIWDALKSISPGHTNPASIKDKETDQRKGRGYWQIKAEKYLEDPISLGNGQLTKNEYQTVLKKAENKWVFQKQSQFGERGSVGRTLALSLKKINTHPLLLHYPCNQNKGQGFFIYTSQKGIIKLFICPNPFKEGYGIPL